ncbi:hypothetical protein ACSW8S_17765 (plasmid) [Clostridium perfringens]
MKPIWIDLIIKLLSFLLVMAIIFSFLLCLENNSIVEGILLMVGVFILYKLLENVTIVIKER